MPFPSVTNTFTNGTTADATQVNQNFTDLINALSDTSKNISVSAITAAGATTLNGAVTLGASTANLLVFNGSVNSNIPVNTNTTYDLGSSTLGFRSLYIGGSSTFTVRILGGTQSASYTLTLPVSGGTNGYVLKTDGLGTTSWVDPSSLTYTAVIFSTSLTCPLHIGGTGAGSTLNLQSTSGVGSTDQVNIYVGNNGGTQAASFQNGGTVFFPSIGTTASAGNAFLNNGAGNQLLRSTSSLRYKEDIKSLTENDIQIILKLNPISFKSKAIADKGGYFLGFIAEEMDKVDSRLVNYIPDNNDSEVNIPDGIQYDRIIVPLVAFVQKQQKIIDKLSNQIAALEAREN